MKNSDLLSEQQSIKIGQLSSWIIAGFIAISFIGFLDASYLTISHYTGSKLSCSLIEGCDVVTTSKYALFLGVPVALFGALYYLSVLILSLLYFDTRNPVLLRIIQPMTILAFLASIYFVLLQIFVIKAICQFCMLSAITSTILFIFGVWSIKSTKHGSSHRAAKADP